MPADFGITLPLWSYWFDGGQLLEQAAGEIGLEHVTVPAVTGPGGELALRLIATGSASDSPQGPHFQTEGGWHFPANSKAYSAVSLRPPRARWSGGTDILSRVREHLDRLAIRLVVRVDLRSVRQLVERHPRLGQRNAWGQQMPSAGLCTCNPDVRALLQATLGDLRRYQPAAYELVDWAPDCPVDRDRPRPLGWHPVARRLLDICFCPSCQQIAEQAGVRPEPVARSVRAQLELLFSRPDRQPPDDPLLINYVQARRREVSLWLSRLAADAPDQRHFLLDRFIEHCMLDPDPPLPRVLALAAGDSGLGAFQQTMSQADGLSVPPRRDAGPTFTWDGDAATFLRNLAAATPGRPHPIHGLALPTWRPLFKEAAGLVRAVAVAAEQGVEWFDFEDLHEAPAQAVTWVRQGVRFARRG